jgi:hypothetical protein
MALLLTGSGIVYKTIWETIKKKRSNMHFETDLLLIINFPRTMKGLY